MEPRLPETEPLDASPSVSLHQLLQLPLEKRSIKILDFGATDIHAAIRTGHEHNTVFPTAISPERIAWALAFNVEGADVSAGGARTTTQRRTKGYRDHWPLETSWTVVWSTLTKPLADSNPDRSTLLRELALSVACEQRHDWQHPPARPLQLAEAARALEFVYANNRNKVVRDISKRFGSRAGDAAAVADEAWARIFCDYWSTNALRRFLGLSRISTLVCQVASFVAIDALRQQRSSGEADNTTAAGWPRRNAVALEEIGVIADPSTNMAFDELQQQIRQCLDRLPPKQRIVAEMVWFREINARRTAQILRISEVAVSQHLKKARATLQNYLQVHGFAVPEQ